MAVYFSISEFIKYHKIFDWCDHYDLLASKLLNVLACNFPLQSCLCCRWFLFRVLNGLINESPDSKGLSALDRKQHLLASWNNDPDDLITIQKS